MLRVIVVRDVRDLGYLLRLQRRGRLRVLALYAVVRVVEPGALGGFVSAARGSYVARTLVPIPI